MTHEESVNRGYFEYEGTFIMQNPNIASAIEKLLSNINLDIIVEIGTHHGGFTKVLADVRNKLGKNTKIYSYDVAGPESVEELAKKYNFIYHKKCMFTDTSIQEELFLTECKDKRIAIFCDGGHKPTEFRTLSKYLKPGDIIGAHDYAKNQEVFERDILGKVWNWMEIKESDIIDSCNMHNLVDLPDGLSDVFANVAWCLKVKQ